MRICSAHLRAAREADFLSAVPPKTEVFLQRDFGKDNWNPKKEKTLGVNHEFFRDNYASIWKKKGHLYIVLHFSTI